MLENGPSKKGPLKGLWEKKKRCVEIQIAKYKSQIFLRRSQKNHLKIAAILGAHGLKNRSVSASGESLTPPGANPLVAERAPWRSSQSCVTGGQQPIRNLYRFLSFLLHTWQPLCDPNSHSWGRLFQPPGGLEAGEIQKGTGGRGRDRKCQVANCRNIL